MRPTAKYMQQHRFAGQYRWPDVERALLPMMEACRLFLAEAAPEELLQQQAQEAAAAAAAGGVGGAMDGMATGHFSWRMPPEGTGEDCALLSPLPSLLPPLSSSFASLPSPQQHLPLPHPPCLCVCVCTPPAVLRRRIVEPEAPGSAVRGSPDGAPFAPAGLTPRDRYRVWTGT